MDDHDAPGSFPSQPYIPGSFYGFENLGTLYRRTGPGDAVNTLRLNRTGLLGRGVYFSDNPGPALSPDSAIARGDCIVHAYVFIRQPLDTDIAYLIGGAAADEEAVLVRGDGTELWRGAYGAGGGDAIPQAAMQGNVKILIGESNSLAASQVALLDLSFIRPVATISQENLPLYAQGGLPAIQSAMTLPDPRPIAPVKPSLAEGRSRGQKRRDSDSTLAV